MIYKESGMRLVSCNSGRCGKCGASSQRFASVVKIGVGFLTTFRIGAFGGVGPVWVYSTEEGKEQLFSLDSKRVLNSRTTNTCTIIKAPPSTLGSALHLNPSFNRTTLLSSGRSLKLLAKNIWSYKNQSLGQPLTHRYKNTVVRLISNSQLFRHTIQNIILSYLFI